MYVVNTLIVVATCVGLPQIAAQEASSLPFAGLDSVVLREDNGRPRRMPGKIEDLKGDTLTFRHDGRGAIQFIRFDDVVRLEFDRSQLWTDGLATARAGDLPRALALFDQALKREKRAWAWNELQAIAALTCIKLGKRNDAVDRIDQIVSRDDRSRHVSVLPLVWDERLPQTDRLRMHTGDLRSDSAVVRLAAASALLHEDLYQDRAVAALHQIRRSSGYRRLSDLAEVQLWRLAIVGKNGQTTALKIWHDRVRSIAHEARHGPQFVLGRCFDFAHEYDRSAIAFLWAGLMAPGDPAVGSQALAGAISCLDRAGKTSAAAAIKLELLKRYPESAAAQTLKADRAPETPRS